MSESQKLLKVELVSYGRLIETIGARPNEYSLCEYAYTLKQMHSYQSTRAFPPYRQIECIHILQNVYCLRDRFVYVDMRVYLRIFIGFRTILTNRPIVLVKNVRRHSVIRYFLRNVLKSHIYLHIFLTIPWVCVYSSSINTLIGIDTEARKTYGITLKKILLLLVAITRKRQNMKLIFSPIIGR